MNIELLSFFTIFALSFLDLLHIHDNWSQIEQVIFTMMKPEVEPKRKD